MPGGTCDFGVLELLLVAGFHLLVGHGDALRPRLLLDNALQNQLLDGGGGEPVVGRLDEFLGEDRLAVDRCHDFTASRQRRWTVFLRRLRTLRLLALLPLRLLALLLLLLLLPLLLLLRFLLRLRLQCAARERTERKHDSKHAR
jgi:hypothetical protein